MQFGPLHAALQIGNVILEWNDSSLVIPHYTDPSDPLLKTDVQFFFKVGGNHLDLLLPGKGSNRCSGLWQAD